MLLKLVKLFALIAHSMKQSKDFPAKCLLLLSSLHLAASWKCLITGCGFQSIFFHYLISGAIS